MGVARGFVPFCFFLGTSLILLNFQFNPILTVFVRVTGVFGSTITVLTVFNTALGQLFRGQPHQGIGTLLVIVPITSYLLSRSSDYDSE